MVDKTPEEPLSVPAATEPGAGIPSDAAAGPSGGRVNRDAETVEFPHAAPADGVPAAPAPAPAPAPKAHRGLIVAAIVVAGVIAAGGFFVSGLGLGLILPVGHSSQIEDGGPGGPDSPGGFGGPRGFGDRQEGPGLRHNDDRRIGPGEVAPTPAPVPTPSGTPG